MLMRPDGQLSRQGRLARTFLIFAVMLTAVVVGSQALAASPIEVQSPAPFDTYTVSPGETLWSIASAVKAPDESTRTVVHEIMDINGLESASITVGDQILIPVAS